MKNHKNIIPKFLKPNKLRKVKKYADNPSVESSARKKIDRAKQKRKRPSKNPNIARGCGVVMNNRRKVTKFR